MISRAWRKFWHYFRPNRWARPKKNKITCPFWTPLCIRINSKNFVVIPSEIRNNLAPFFSKSLMIIFLRIYIGSVWKTPILLLKVNCIHPKYTPINTNIVSKWSFDICVPCHSMMCKILLRNNFFLIICSDNFSRRNHVLNHFNQHQPYKWQRK